MALTLEVAIGLYGVPEIRIEIGTNLLLHDRADDQQTPTVHPKDRSRRGMSSVVRMRNLSIADSSVQPQEHQFPLTNL